MGRVTRKKAAEIAEQLHVDEDAVLDMETDENASIKAKMATPEHDNRSPLGEIAPNSAESREREEEPVEELKKSTRGRKGGKKGAVKGKKNNLGASTITLPEDGEVTHDENESAPSPASEKAAKALISAEPELQAANVNIPDRSQSPPSAAVRLTRSQLAKKSEAETEAEQKSLVDGTVQKAEGQDGYFVSDNGKNPTIEMSEPAEMSETAAVTVLDAPASPLPTAVPNVIKSLRSDTPAKRSTSNKENVQPESDNGMATPRNQSSVYDALEHAVVAAATPPRSEAHESPKPEDPIAALDELEDAVENVSRDIPEVQDSPVKKSKARSPKRPHLESAPKPQSEPATEEAPRAEEKKAEAKKESKKPAPVVRTTKAAQARISMAQNKDPAASKAPSLGRPRPSTTLGRSNSVRQSVALKAEATAASKRIPSNPKPSVRKSSTSTDAQPPREKKEANIPHSKTRPVSLSFPTPPPPPKSTKATTSSTFQLPGEAVAAKLKAAREARMAKEAEDAEAKKKAVFKARPAPKAGGVVPSVRQTNASRARESIMAGKPAPMVAHKRANTVGGGSTTERPRTVSKESATAKPAPTAARPRPSTSLASSKVRPSLVQSTSSTTTTKSATTSRVPSNGTGTAKGKEVFARTANAKLAADKSKAEKEAAAKKARAEAAERGRVKSREWAERQRLRKLGLKPTQEGKEEVDGGEQNTGAEEVPAVEGSIPVDEAAVVEEAAPATKEAETAAA